jgi:hypothetical protein
MGEVLDLQQPWMSELNIAAMVLLGVAWLTLVLGLRWQLKTKAFAELPGLASLAFAPFAGVMAIGNSGNAEDHSPEMLVSIMPELVAVVALVANLGIATRGSRPPHPPPGSRAMGVRRLPTMSRIRTTIQGCSPALDRSIRN